MTDNTIKISIIVPAFNSEKYIEKCLNSLITQTYENLEIIVVDDGSKDETGKIVNQLMDDKRINLITLEENRGTYQARIIGFKAATGLYIGTIDSDDWIEKDFIETLLKPIRNKANTISECRIVSRDEKNRARKIKHAEHNFKHIKHTAIIKLVLKREVWHILANKLFHRDLFEKNIPFYNSISEKIIIADDKLIGIPMFFCATELTSIKKPLYNYRTRIDSSSNLRSIEHELKHIRDTYIVDKNIERYIQENSVDTNIIELLKSNRDQEIKLMLKNLSNYKPDSKERIKGYDEISRLYNGTALAVSQKDYQSITNGNSTPYTKASYFKLVLKHAVITENIFRSLLCHYYKPAYYIYYPLYGLGRKLEDVFKRLRGKQ